MDILRDPPKGNRIGVIGVAFSVLYPELGEPDYPMIGRTANNLKSAALLLRLMWEVAPTRPQVVDCAALMIYLQGVHRHRGRQQTQQKEAPRNNSQQKADSEFKRQLRQRKEARERAG